MSRTMKGVEDEVVEDEVVDEKVVGVVCKDLNEEGRGNRCHSPA